MTGRNIKKLLAGAMCLLMLIPFAFGVSGAENNSNYEAKITQLNNSISDELISELFATTGVKINNAGKPEVIDDEEMVCAIITLNEKPLLSYEGMKANSGESKALEIISKIKKQQETVKSRIEKDILFDTLDVRYTYSRVLNGFSVTVPYGKLKEIAKIDGVKSAAVSGIYFPSEIKSDEPSEPAVITTNAANTTEYKGEGMIIAILDTGLQMSHPLFASDVPDPALSREAIETIIASGNLIATESLPNFNVNQAYKRVKIPYQFDYGYRDADANHDSGSSHGTHVAGIACGNSGVNSSVDPVAPNAQLIVMKVFRSDSSGEFAYDSDIFAAIEDCAVLGVDAINMSLGSDGGFTSASTMENMENALMNAKNAGSIISASAGNAYSGSYGAKPRGESYTGNLYGINPDNSIVGSPSTYLASLSIASHTSGSAANRTMSDFSSLGAAPDLVLKPELSAFGDGVYSSVPGGGYGEKSGTSMSAPHVTGGMAAVKQYLKLIYPSMSESDLYNRVCTLLMNTADSVKDNLTPTLPISPRKQGAGAMNIANAIGTPAYITVPGNDRPKFDQMDDIEETGVYNFTFVIHNTARAEQQYQITAIPLTERAGTISGPEGPTTYMTENSYPLSAGLSTNFPDNIVTISGGSEVTVNATLSLTRKDIMYIKSNFANGCYVEGFIKLLAQGTNSINLSVPFLCFFGDWTKPATLDNGFYFDTINGNPDWTNYYTNEILTTNGSSDTYLGTNPGGSTLNYLADRNAISPNGDSKFEAIEMLRLGLLRGVKLLSYTITGEDGSVYYTKNIPYVTRTSCNYYMETLYCGYYEGERIDRWQGTDANSNPLPNGTRATLTVKAEVDFDIHESNCSNDTWVIPITIDTEAPTMTKASVSVIGDRKYLDVTVSDNHYIANLSVTNATFTSAYVNMPIAESERGLTKSYRIDITNCNTNNLGLVALDYAANKSTYSLDITDITDTNKPITDAMKILGSDFENATFPPSGWSINNTSENTWTRESGDTFVARINPSTSAQNEWLVLPTVNLSEYDNQINVAFRFVTDYEVMVQNANAAVSLRISKDGENFETIYTTATESMFTSWANVEKRIYIPYAYQNETVTLAFVYEGQNGARFDLDNVYVYDNQTPVLENPSESSESLDDILNIEGGTLTFTNENQKPWIVTDTDGRKCAKSGNASMNNTSSTLTLNANELAAGLRLKFDWKVSSESNYDYLEFKVNGTTMERISGFVGWQTFTYNITSTSNYTFSWIYSKDSSASTGDDCGYLDNVSITAPIAVTGLTLSATSLNMEMGQYALLATNVMPENASDKTCTYSSDNPAIASVTNNGVINALAIGSATITATTVDGGFTASCVINVSARIGLADGYSRIVLFALDPWNDGSGYQLLLDSDATAYGTIIPTVGSLTPKGNASAGVYQEFEYKIPTDADGSTTTSNVVLNNAIYIDVPAGTYDFCVTNPVPNDRIWIAGGENARKDNFDFRAGFEYTLSCTASSNGDTVSLAEEYIGSGPIPTPTIPPVTPTIPPVTPTPTIPPVTPTPTIPPVTPTPIPYAMGDANLDGYVNTGDAACILRFIVGLAPMNETQLFLSDINVDGYVNTGDAALILSLAASSSAKIN
ncbi:MAG: S8 family serine peptidase [Clostridia bacterium]